MVYPYVLSYLKGGVKVKILGEKILSNNIYSMINYLH